LTILQTTQLAKVAKKPTRLINKFNKFISLIHRLRL